jgi:hypothetical protein
MRSRASGQLDSLLAAVPILRPLILINYSKRPDQCANTDRGEDH